MKRRRLVGDKLVSFELPRRQCAQSMMSMVLALDRRTTSRSRIVGFAAQSDPAPPRRRASRPRRSHAEDLGCFPGFCSVRVCCCLTACRRKPCIFAPAGSPSRHDHCERRAGSCSLQSISCRPTLEPLCQMSSFANSDSLVLDPGTSPSCKYRPIDVVHCRQPPCLTSQSRSPRRSSPRSRHQSR